MTWGSTPQSPAAGAHSRFDRPVTLVGHFLGVADYAQATFPSANAGFVACESRVWARTGELLAVGASQLLCRPAPPQ